ncbi:MAG: YigZ family protein, partial [Flavisolibacter sp.]|nr:YigZ family protein [Flavisolibacter sp.]
QLTPITEKPILVQYVLEFDYTLMNDVMTFIKRYGAVIIENEAQLFCRLLVGVPKAEEQVFMDRITDIHGIEVKKI